MDKLRGKSSNRLKTKTLRPLTPKEKQVLDYITSYIQRSGVSPSFFEIKTHFDFASFNSVQRYVQQLESKGYLHNPGGNQKRALQVLHASSALTRKLESVESLSPLRAGAIGSLPVPLLGQVAAGLPIESHTFDETIEAPLVLLRRPEMSFALKVKGDSMIEDGIFDGDMVLVQQQDHARSGEIVVAVVENEATVKRIYWPKNEKEKIELRPANSAMQSLWYPVHRVEIRGVVVGLLRKY